MICLVKNGGKNIISNIISGLENLQLFPNAGIPISVIYDVESEFEKYYVLFIEKNYFLYYIENDIIYIVEIFNEKEDVAGRFFGIHTTTQKHWISGANNIFRGDFHFLIKKE